VELRPPKHGKNHPPSSTPASFIAATSIVGPNGLRVVDRIDFRELALPQSRYEVRVGGKVVREKSQRRLLIPYFQVDGNRLSPNQLSEGTFKTIALLF
jgi:hypothetical protein